jgi:hypothetical protein
VQGRCRLRSNVPLHQTFFRTLARYAQQMCKKGCPRTALEFGRLLWNLAPEEDPCCVTHVLDYYAVRGREYDWMCEFALVAQWNGAALQYLPNWAFSTALARFLAPAVTNSAVDTSARFADASVGDLRGASASRLLQWALLMFPEVLGQLLAKAGGRDTPQRQALLEHPHFRKGRDRVTLKPLAGKL